MKLLVTIASFGTKNLPYLKVVIEAFRSLPYATRIVVLSDAEKELGPEIDVIVGLPSKDPWSLPFAHKKVLADSVNDYDVFAYCEDDMLVSRKNIEAFLWATTMLSKNEVPGFIRYEIAPGGEFSIPEAHGHYHFKPSSVRKIGEHLFAEFSNEHSAFYLLTRDQLQSAINSGGYLLGPRQGRYGTPETAATDPYTVCGLKRLVCVSKIDDFLIHHLPNRYVGVLGLPLHLFREQIKTLRELADGKRPACSLELSESQILHGMWSKSYYEEAESEVLDSIPRDCRSLLSIGCGFGITEIALQRRGIAVSAIPLDSVIGAAAERNGVTVINGNFESAFQRLSNTSFDCVLISNLLHLHPWPEQIVERALARLREGGLLLVVGPNFRTLPVLAKRFAQVRPYNLLADARQSGVNIVSPGNVISWMKNLEGRAEVSWMKSGKRGSENRSTFKRLTMSLLPGSLIADSWIVSGRKAGQ